MAMLLIVGSAVLGFVASRRWWLVLIPIAIGAFFGSAVNATSGFLAPATAAAGFAAGMLARRFIDRRRQPEISD
jgi:hypothetical protein